MVKIRKRDGREEEFSAIKFEESLKKAGATPEVAREIAQKAPLREGMTSDEIRRYTIEELRRRDARIATNYEMARKLAARRAVDASAGTAKLNEEIFRQWNLTPGEPVELEHAGRKHTLRTVKAPVGLREIQLNEADLRALGAPEGTRITVRNPKPPVVVR